MHTVIFASLSFFQKKKKNENILCIKVVKSLKKIFEVKKVLSSILLQIIL